MNIVIDDGDFGIMTWRLLSREGKTEIYALPITGLGTYIRTVIEGRHEEPILLKNVLMLETIMREDGPKIVDAKGAETGEPTFKCLGREIMTLDVAKKRFMPKGKNAQPGLELYAGALLTQEQRPMPMVMPAGGGPPPEVLAKLKEAAKKANEAQP